jgi:hypothetical protein
MNKGFNGSVVSHTESGSEQDGLEITRHYVDVVSIEEFSCITPLELIEINLSVKFW